MLAKPFKGRMSADSFGAVAADFVEAGRSWRLWSKFAWYDLLARYRRSWVGPLWLGLTALVFMSALTLVYGTLFSEPIRDYLPFVAVGVTCWNFLFAVTSEAVVTFVEAETYIRQIRVNLFIFVFRVLWRNILVFLHQFAVAFAVVVLAGKFSVVLLPRATLGIVLMFVQGIWVIPLLGLLGTRFRDLQPMITNLLQIMFFVTPVIWVPAALGPRRWLADINPLNSLLAIIRDPLLGALPAAHNYAFVLMITAAGFGLSTLIYTRFHKRVVYWL
jgi:ABC-type polysaccharide/polyol phosphate export permease